MGEGSLRVSCVGTFRVSPRSDDTVRLASKAQAQKARVRGVSYGSRFSACRAQSRVPKESGVPHRGLQALSTDKAGRANREAT